MKHAVLLGVLVLGMSAIVAGNLAGSWDFVAKSSSGETYDLTLYLRETDGKVSGDLGNYEGSIPLEKVQVEEDSLKFDITTPEGITYSADLSVKGETMEGSYSGTDGSSGTITAKKENKE